MRTLSIGTNVISDESRAYVIAEVGHNHQGQLDAARRMFFAAKEAGASAVKLQKRHNRNVYTREVFDRPYGGANSYGATYGAHREFLEFGDEEYRNLRDLAATLDIDFFTTTFDEESVAFAKSLGLPALKIASGDLTNTPLLLEAGKTGIPLIVSTGGASLSDVVQAVTALQSVSASFGLLQCTATYPARADQLNLRVIETYRNLFPDIVIGYSGHDMISTAPVAAFSLGARIIERHLTLDKTAPGSDHHFSQTPDEMRQMVDDLALARSALGSFIKQPLIDEVAALDKMAKTIVVSGALSAGTCLDQTMLKARTSGRPGLRPSQLPRIIGATLSRDVDDEHVLTPSDLVGYLA